MSVSLQRGLRAKLPKEFCNVALQETIAVSREELVRIFKSIGSTRSNEVKRLLTTLGIADSDSETSGQTVVVS